MARARTPKRTRARAKAIEAKARLSRKPSASVASSKSNRAVPGVGQATPRQANVNPRTSRRLARDPDVMRGRIAVGAGPYSDRIQSYAASNLDPTKLDAIYRAADMGVGIYRYADFNYQMRRRDAHLKGIDRQRRWGVAKSPFMVWPRLEQDPLCVALAHAGRAIIDGIDGFQRAIYELHSKNCDGWGLLEKVWAPGTIRFQVPDGNGGGPMVSVNGIWPRALFWVHPKHTEFAQDSGDEPFINLGPDGTVPLPEHKFVYSLADGEGLASTRGYSQAVAWPHFFKHASIRDWNVFLHIYGIPFLQGKVDRKLWKDTAMRSVLEEALEKYGDGEHAPILPDGLAIEVNDPVSMGGAGDAHKSLAGFMNAEQSKAVLGVTLTTEPGESGSYNLGEVHRDSEQDVIDGDGIGTADDVRADVLLDAIVVNAEELSRALAEHGLEARPELLPLGLPQCGFRTGSDWSPKTRLEIFCGLAGAGLKGSKSQVRRELQYDAPTSPDDEFTGRPVVIPQGGAAVGAGDAAAGVVNEKKEPAPANGAPNAPSPSGDGEE